MEDNTVKMNEIEEIENVDEGVEVSESSNAGAFVAGIAGGLLAYAIVQGAKKVTAFIGAKLDARKHQEKNHDAVDVDFVEVESDQEDSGEETDK